MKYRILITLDKDFGDIAFNQKLPIKCGIIFFRGRISSLKKLANFAVKALESREDWEGNFTMINRTRIRMRPMR